jgi:hypothetical protein
MILVTISFAPLSAQKWVNLNNRWTTSVCCSGGGFGQGSFYTASFFKDSVFMKDHYYYQLYTSIDSLLQIVNPTNEYYREEKGIVYYLDKYGSPEVIIYNFNLTKGDSITYYTGSNGRIIKVISVDTIELLNGEKRKRWSLLDKGSKNLPSNIRHWVEGIGAIEFVTFYPRLLFFFDVFGGVICYFFKEQYLFGVYKGDCPNRLGPRQGPVSTRDIATLTSFRLLQNTGDGNIRFHLDAPGRYRCQVFDAMGKQLQSPPVSQGVNNVSLTDSPKGIYILHIYDLENQQQMGLKVVRQ